ncbi:ribosome silencing factor [Rhodoligotrophos defluvii]|uniref:ribosome silencing factor n=1 Tax=Rhodoligotrophos defluvii TaxID=2561934 RepID=UPI001EEFEF5B|nr:ribosome silencing factor [Rhodoligotrophos defluvii]
MLPEGSISKLVAEVRDSLDDSKAEDVVAIDLTGRTPIADYMVIASGRSDRHVGAIAEHLVENLKKSGHRDIKVQGLTHCDWVLVDTGDVIVHIFRPDVREFYNLEKLWSENAPIERRV